MTVSWLTDISNLLSPTLASVALVLAAGAVTRGKVRRIDRMSIVWAFFAVGMLSWFISEVAWNFYPYYWGIPAPFPSLADPFGVAGYVPVIVGLLFMIWPYRSVFHSKSLVTASLLTLVTVLSFSALPFLYGHMDHGALAVGLLYLILDVLVLSMAVPTLMVLRQGSFWKPFLLLVCGITFALFGHLLSNWMYAFASYYPVDPSDLLLDCGYVFAAAGSYMRMMQLSEKTL